MLAGGTVGTLNTDTTDPRCGTFIYGLSISPEHRRQGFAAEAMQLVLQHFFLEQRYQKVNAEVYSFNEASQRRHESLGFSLEGRLRRMICTDGVFQDALIDGLTREEFEAQALDWG
jgi:RimJ/RimL family protein N-acetyltransferase